jgi:hypothetical protein
MEAKKVQLERRAEGERWVDCGKKEVEWWTQVEEKGGWKKRGRWMERMGQG